MRINNADSVTIPATTVTPLANLINLNPNLVELGIKVEPGDTIYWSIKKDGAIIGDQPLTNGFLSLPMRVDVANQMSFNASVSTKLTIIQVVK